MRTRCQLIGGFALSALLAAAPAWACSYHGGIMGGLTRTYPGSLSVAVAIAKARAKGALPNKRLPKSLAYRQALANLEGLKRTIEKTGPPGRPTQFSLVLISSGLWSSYMVSERGVQARYHLKAPLPGQAVIITDASVLRAVNSRKLRIADALSSGLIRVANDPDRTVAGLFAQANSTMPLPPRAFR